MEQNFEIVQKMKQKLSVIVLGAIILLSLVSCTACSFPSINPFEKNISTSSMSMDYDSFSGQKATTLSLKENESIDVEIDIVTKGGKISLSIVNEDSKSIYKGIDIPTSAFSVTLNEKGKYEITVNGEKHKGSFSVFWKKGETTKINKSNQMSIYISQYDTLLLDAVKEFNSININSPIVANKLDYSKGMEEPRKKIITEIMAGEGPDIIYASNERMFPSIRKMFESGAFCDLNSLIKKDLDFNLSDYNQTVLDSGIINGKRYVIPLSYTIPSLWTTKKILDRNNIHIDSSKWTWKDFFSEAKKYMDKHNGEKKYFVGFPYDEPQYIMSDLCGELVDYKNKKTNFNSPKFISFLQDYKAISASVCPNDEITTLDKLNNQLKNDSIVTISTDGYISPYHVYSLNSILTERFSEELFLLNNPSLDESSPKSAYPTSMIGVNSNSKFKEEAFEFIKLLLSDNYQSIGMYLSSIPVNIKGYANSVDSYAAAGVRGNSEMYLGTNIESSVPLPAEVVKNMNEVISSINTCKLVDPRIADIASSEVTEYLNSNRSAEATAKRIDEKVMIYLNE